MSDGVGVGWERRRKPPSAKALRVRACEMREKERARKAAHGGMTRCAVDPDGVRRVAKMLRDLDTAYMMDRHDVDWDVWAKALVEAYLGKDRGT